MSIADRTPRSARNAMKSADKLAGETGIASGTVATPVATPPAKMTDKPAQIGDNQPTASTRAHNLANNAWREIDRADGIMASGVQMLSAAIVEYNTITRPMTFAELLATARDVERNSKTTLWSVFKQEMARLFVTPPIKAVRNATAIELIVAKDSARTYAAHYARCDDACQIAICVMIQGGTIGDFNGTNWNMHAHRYAPTNVVVDKPKARVTMERGPRETWIAAKIVKIGDDADAVKNAKPILIARDYTNFVEMVSAKFKLFDRVEKPETDARPGEQRAPHHNDTAPKPDATPGNTPAQTTGSVGNLPPIPTTGMVPVPPSGLAPIVPDASANANPDVDRRNNPDEIAAASHSFAANCAIVRATLRQSLGVSNLRQVTAKPTKEIAAKIGPHTIENDAWQTIEEIGIMWATLVGIKLPAEYLASAAKAQTETKMGDATLSTPIPPASVRNAKPVEVRRAPRKVAKGRKRAA